MWLSWLSFGFRLAFVWLVQKLFDFHVLTTTTKKEKKEKKERNERLAGCQDLLAIAESQSQRRSKNTLRCTKITLFLYCVPTRYFRTGLSLFLALATVADADACLDRAKNHNNRSQGVRPRPKERHLLVNKQNPHRHMLTQDTVHFPSPSNTGLGNLLSPSN